MKKPIDGGGCAFPTDDESSFEPGLSKRGYFAAAIMSHMISGSINAAIPGRWSDIASKAVIAADALLNELNKEQTV